MTKSLEPPDSHHLDDAQGWLGLGDWASANQALDEIAPGLCAHPAVLEARVDVYEAAGQWAAAAEVSRALTLLSPDRVFGWVHWAYSLHELKRVSEAREVLLPAVEKFPHDSFIRYSLACYACQLGNYPEAFQWLEMAVALADANDLKRMVLNNPELQPFWNGMGKL